MAYICFECRKQQDHDGKCDTCGFDAVNDLNNPETLSYIEQLRVSEMNKREARLRWIGVVAGMLIVFGLPFLAAGLFMLLTALQLSGVPMDEDLSPLFLLILGLLFTAAGIALIFGRSGVTVDRTAQSVTKWWGLLVPMIVTRYNLARFDRITVGKEVRRDSASEKMVFPVCLAGSREAKDVEYDAPTDYPSAQRISEELARFTGRDIEDLTSGRTIRRRP